MLRYASEPDLLAYLDEHDVVYTRSEHPPVYTCEEAAQYRSAMPGVETKNLFLRDEKRNFFLVMTACAKRLDLKGLGQSIDAPKLHFASPEQLMDVLGLAPGSVTVLALVNDLDRKVILLVDQEYWPSEAYLCHPLVNTATLVLEHSALARFLDSTGHVPHVVTMPGQKE